MRMISRRLTKLETAKRKHKRDYVVRVRDGETTKEALARFFAPYGGETWPVAVLPEPCNSIDEWLERYAPNR